MKSWYPFLVLRLLLLIKWMKEDSLAEALLVPAVTVTTSRGDVLSPRLSSSLSMMDLSSSTFTGMEMVNDFFQTQPFVAAFMTCSLKASTADVLAQTSSSPSSSDDENGNDKSTTIQMKHHHHHHHHVYSIINNLPTSWWEAWNEKKVAADTPTTSSSQEDNSPSSSSSAVNWSRTLAFYLYGGLYQGMFLQFLYTIAYPTLYGNHPHQLLLQVHTDIVVFGPFVTLPLAYVLRAWIDGTTSSQPTMSEDLTAPQDTTTTHNNNNNVLFMEQAWFGLQKYKNHIVSQNLLWKYWAIWGPAQTFNFTMVPPHLRVVFVACVSFFWVYLLSMISSQGIMPTTTTKEGTTENTTTIPTSSSHQTAISSWRIQDHWQDMQDSISRVWKNNACSTNPLSKPVRSA